MDKDLIGSDRLGCCWIAWISRKNTKKCLPKTF